MRSGTRTSTRTGTGTHTIGVDVGGTKVAAGLVDEAGTIQRRTRRPTPSASPDDVEDVIAACVQELSEGVEVEGAVQHGHPADSLCDVVREQGAAHLVVGRLGQSRVRSLLFGSTPGSLIQVATVPVTVVP